MTLGDYLPTRIPLFRQVLSPRSRVAEQAREVSGSQGVVEPCLVSGLDFQRARRSVVRPRKVFDAASGNSIGFHEITWQIRALRLDRGELGYWLSPAHQRKGIMTEAVQAVSKAVRRRTVSS